MDRFDSFHDNLRSLRPLVVSVAAFWLAVLLVVIVIFCGDSDSTSGVSP